MITDEQQAETVRTLFAQFVLEVQILESRGWLVGLNMSETSSYPAAKAGKLFIHIEQNVKL